MPLGHGTPSPMLRLLYLPVRTCLLMLGLRKATVNRLSLPDKARLQMCRESLTGIRAERVSLGSRVRRRKLAAEPVSLLGDALSGCIGVGGLPLSQLHTDAYGQQTLWAKTPLRWHLLASLYRYLLVIFALCLEPSWGASPSGGGAKSNPLQRRNRLIQLIALGAQLLDALEYS